MKTLNPNNFGKKYLVEECQKIRLKEFLKVYRDKLKKITLTAQLETLGSKIELTTSKTCFNGIRFWFKCPMCSRRVGVLFKHPLTSQIGCRICLNLDYRKRRYKGMIEENLQ